MEHWAATEMLVSSPELVRYDPFLPLSRIAGADLPFDVRFGGAMSRAYPMHLRFGPVEPGDILAGHLLVMAGARQDVIRDAVVWDHATRAFVIAVPREIDRLAVNRRGKGALTQFRCCLAVTRHRRALLRASRAWRGHTSAA